MKHLAEILVMTGFMIAGFITTTAAIYGTCTLAHTLGWYAT